jgi:hypothetical protein
MLERLPVGESRLVYSEYGFFGFGFYTIDCPEDMVSPFLLHRVDRGKTSVLIAPVGKWSDWYFSAEIDHARSLGYVCTFVKGHHYSQSSTDLFRKYVNEMYELKSSATDPLMRQTAKLLLNSLYGRFGLNLGSQVEMVCQSEQSYAAVHAKFVVTDEKTITWDDGLAFVISHENELNEGFCKLHPQEAALHYAAIKKQQERAVFNVAIAAAVTAYSRILIDPFKRIPGNPCLYSDTDSVFLVKPLDSSFLGSEIGLMKNEVAPKGSGPEEDSLHYITSPVFAAPKVYTFIAPDGKAVVKFKGFARKQNPGPNNVMDLYRGFAVTTPSYSRIQRSIAELRSSIFTSIIQADFSKRIKVFTEGVWTTTSPIVLALPVPRLSMLDSMSMSTSTLKQSVISAFQLAQANLLTEGYNFNPITRN